MKTPNWPPSTESPYDNPAMQQSKPGNFFTLCEQDHPAYDLFRALNEQGWSWSFLSGRHWITMTNGERYLTFSLFGQGCFGDGVFPDSDPIRLEDYDNVWSDALPHIARFMRTTSDERAHMFARAKAFAERRAAAGGEERTGGVIEPYYDRDGITIYCADCRDVLPMLEPGSIDLVLTDPPYGLGDRWDGGKGGGKSAWHCSRDEVKAWDVHAGDVVTDLVGRFKSVIIWGGNYYALPPTRGWLSWDKMQAHSGSDFELAWTNLDIPARVFRMSRIEAYGKGKDHPTQKPLNLFRWCLSFVPYAQVILDPFMGSGTTLRAAKDLGRRAIGIEIEERYCEIAVKRLQQSVLPLEIGA